MGIIIGIIIFFVIIILLLWIEKSDKSNFEKNLKIGAKWSLKDVGANEKVVITITSIVEDCIFYKREYLFYDTLKSVSMNVSSKDDFYLYIIFANGERIN